MHLYLNKDVRLFTVLVIILFAGITLTGVKESSVVAMCLITLHMAVLSVLVVWGLARGIDNNFELFLENMHTPLPDIVSTSGAILSQGNVVGTIFFGYCTALLGITGFESAANFVEEMEHPSVFVGTVNYMWLAVGFFNPALCLTSLMVLPLETISTSTGEMLALMADALGGKSFGYLVAADAVLILCGAVLTSYIGVSNLMIRMSKDKLLPRFLASVASNGSPYMSVISFCVGCIVLFLVIFDPTNPSAINEFGSVYSMAFLSVLSAFALAAVLLKTYRGNLARLVITKWWQVYMSFICVFLGLLGKFITLLLLILLFL